MRALVTGGSSGIGAETVCLLAAEGALVAAIARGPAPAIDGNFRVHVSGGQSVMAPAGSTAAREAIERYQLLFARHGHIHESKGATRIGRTALPQPGFELRPRPARRRPRRTQGL